MKEKEIHLELRVLTPEDVMESYVDWFNDSTIVKFSDNQYREFSLKGQIDYVSKIYKDKNIKLFGIFDSGQHIGNITINGIDSKHKRTEVSYVIGDKNYWGKGIATRAIFLICEKQKMNIN